MGIHKTRGYSYHCDSGILAFNMAAKNGQKLGGDVSSKDMTVEEFSNIFASEFNNSEIHDRVLCFQIIKDKEFDTKDDESQSESKGPDGLFISIFI